MFTLKIKRYANLKIYLIILLFLIEGCNFKSDGELLKEGEQEIVDEKLEEARLDSLNYYLTSSDENRLSKKNDLAILYLDSALSVSKYDETDSIISKRALILYESKRYDDAISDYSELINSEYDRVNTHYYRALCYQGQHKTQEVVDDLRLAISLGNTEAEELHEKINPLRKRVAYYITRCCDGSTSTATGRGACSHHGGVCDWNEPVYEEYRKY